MRPLPVAMALEPLTLVRKGQVPGKRAPDRTQARAPSEVRPVKRAMRARAVQLRVGSRRVKPAAKLKARKRGAVVKRQKQGALAMPLMQEPAANNPSAGL